MLFVGHTRDQVRRLQGLHAAASVPFSEKDRMIRWTIARVIKK